MGCGASIKEVDTSLRVVSEYYLTEEQRKSTKEAEKLYKEIILNEKLQDKTLRKKLFTLVEAR